MPTMRVLWADDDNYFLRALQSLLEDAGCHVDAVDDLREASACIAERTYAIVVLDVFLPPAYDEPPFDRRLGLRLVTAGFKRGIRKFVLYTVLEDAECEKELERLRKDLGATLDVDYFAKGSSVAKVATRILAMIAQAAPPEEHDK